MNFPRFLIICCHVINSRDNTVFIVDEDYAIQSNWDSETGIFFPSFLLWLLPCVITIRCPVSSSPTRVSLPICQISHIAAFLFSQVKINISPAEEGKGTKTRRNILIECEGQGLVNEDVVPPEDSLERVDTTVWSILEKRPPVVGVSYSV